MGQHLITQQKRTHVLKNLDLLRPLSQNGRRKIAQKSIEVDAKTKDSTKKIEEKLDGRNKEGHELKKSIGK